MKRGCPRHPKLDDLMRVAKVRRGQAVGWLELLWHATAEFAPQGNIGRCSDAWIEAQLDWSGRPGMLIEYLVSTRWLVRHSKWRLLVHDWHDHADDSVRKRLGRSSLCFLTVEEEVTGQYPVSDRKVSATQSDNGSLPEPEPEPKPEPLPPNPPSGGGSPNRKVHRRKPTSDEIRHALGDERLKWWTAFWEVYKRACPHDMRGGMEAFERKVKSRELAECLWRGAKRYAEYIEARRRVDPSTPAKYASGWINGERYTDEYEVSEMAKVDRTMELARKQGLE